MTPMESNKRHITDQDYEDIIEILEQMRSSNDYSTLYDDLLAIFREVEELSPTIVLRPPMRVIVRNKQKNMRPTFNYNNIDAAVTKCNRIIDQMIDAASKHKPNTLIRLFMELSES
jgi:hypothetical protein